MSQIVYEVNGFEVSGWQAIASIQKTDHKSHGGPVIFTTVDAFMHAMGLYGVVK
jgi:hypothetical protein